MYLYLYLYINTHIHTYKICVYMRTHTFVCVRVWFKRLKDRTESRLFVMLALLRFGLLLTTTEKS